MVSSGDVRSANMLQLHVIKEEQTDMKDAARSVVYRKTRDSFYEVSRDSGSLQCSQCREK